MVILVAAILSTASMVLKPYQEANIRAEKIQGILASANIQTSRKDAEENFRKHILEEIAVDTAGNVVMKTTDGKTEWTKEGEKIKNAVKYTRPFDINLKEELALEEEARQGKATRSPIFPLFKMKNNGKEYYVVPVRGTGLWGPIWGNIAFEKDFNTIAGATFDHKGETPGLGAEIKTAWFEDEFKGKTIFDKDRHFVSVAVVKGGVKNSNIPLIHGVDAISGGTITSHGVDKMLRTCLKNYVPYIEKNIQ
jgi:Na+-transporting NADH:ubiquinone oxidoreductase subunit C